MKIQPVKIGAIPAILWGDPSEKVYIHVHGKMSCKEYAENFAVIAAQKGFQTLSFDLPRHGERKDEDDACDIWNGMHDLSLVADYAFSKWSDVSLFACSLGAYFSLNTYADRRFTKCLFQSPVVDMEYLVRQMLLWFGVTEERLQAEKVIPTPVDDLQWDYFRYITAHPVTKWDFPTSILYGGRDNMQSLEVITQFAKAHRCRLTVAENSEHPFMQPEDLKIVDAWLRDTI